MRQSIFKQFAVIMIIPVLFITFANFFILNQIQKNRIEDQETYCEATLNNIKISLSIQSENMSKGASIFANSQYAQMLLSSKSETEKNKAKKNLSDMISLSKIYNSNLVDILLCSSESTASLFGYISLNLEHYIKSYIQNNSGVNSVYTAYYDINSNNTYLIHFTPIFATKITANYRKQLGYVVMVSSFRTVSQLINSSKNIFIELVDINADKVLISNTSNFDLKLSGTDSSNQAVSKIPSTNLVLIGTPQTNLIDNKSTTFESFSIFTGIFYLVFLFYIFIAVDKTIIKPVNRLNKQIKSINFEDARIKHTARNEIGSIGAHINELLDKISSLNKKNIESQAKLYEMEISKKETQLYAYQSQINPHFLFNMLQCMRGISLIHGVKELANICTNMADLFRYSIKGDNYVTLKDELDIIDKYLYMISVRFQTKIHYQIFVDDSLQSCKIPKMILQPIIENSVFHGLEKIDGYGTINIKAVRFGDTLKLYILDNGIGIPYEKLADIKKSLEDNQINMKTNDVLNIGLTNINNKIKLYEGNEYGLEIESKDRNTTVIFTLKYQT
ncbi:sensor histidine kinase YesM [Ruminiclostridium sufflavum DSM 19573]|uniref:Sensor histidine kinase YesM n=1 Tax=Ruminiclostridium sufflavum DSM 19573 TaxID=1121337 RepID=A0A318Y8S6_9FIRM|nr:histidine kinase [Ruminiclostridium sufflavum]PYG88718.1 sensor histidine kinase YesM [Ruminiclostridium sufflavum DSM 19573]